jgi:hAT family C-terminal dimerisation region
MVTRWLKSFRSATTQMSATKTPMLSSTHAIFRGLQAEIRDILRDEQGLSPRLIQGLSDAHLKLSEYYYKFDESPFYLWASRKSPFINYLRIRLTPLLVLDPSISYSALSEEFEDDEDLAPFLEAAKNKLHVYYKSRYIKKPAPFPAPSYTFCQTIAAESASPINRSPQKNFTARFRKRRVPIDELLEFWKLPQEDFDTCNPIQWWLSRQASFPNLYRLACDILSIPGEFVYFSSLFVPHCPPQLLLWL